MPRERKPKLKKRPDGRYACRYKDQWFYSYDHDECLKLREEYKEAEKRGRIAVYFVSEYAQKWLERNYPDDTNRKTLGNVKRHITILKDAIGNLPVNDVRPSDIKEIYAKYYKGLSNGYTLKGKGIFCAVFDSAVADGMILSNPARDRTAKPNKGKSGGHRSITPQEREWILTKGTDHPAHPVVMAMLYAGLRPQEAKAIDIDRDVDFKRETITVRQTAHTDPDNGQKYVFTDTGKTDKANRTIPLLPPLKTALEGRKGALVKSMTGQTIRVDSWDNVWTSYKHQMETEINGIRHRWYGRTKEQKDLAAAGNLTPWITFDVTPYDLRHSFITMCRDLKPYPVELHTVIKWVGHSDATMILKIYDEVTDNRDDSEAQRLRDSLTTDLTTKPCT